MKVEKTTFVTFYSFKGGVGRSMALVNTAYLLYESGRKVLIIDADLEAPGLWNVGSLKYNTKHQGFVEFVLEYRKRCDEYLKQGPESDYPKDNIIPDPKEYIASVEIEEIQDKSEGYGPGGKIDIMPAGAKNKKYSEKLLSINFEELFSKYSGSLFFQETRERIRNSKQYDYVLIDSRTGFSDAGDICTHELCDNLIVLTSLNNQNIEGTKSFLDEWKKNTGNIEKKEIALVATPVPFGEEELKRERLETAKEKLGKNIDLEILYHPQLALIEEPFVFNWPESPIARSYRRISSVVRRWGGDNVGVWVDKFQTYFKDKKYDEALNYLKELTILDRRNAIATLKTLTYQVAPSDKDFLKSSLPYFKLLDQNEPNQFATLGNWGNALAALGKKEEAIEKFKKAIEIKSDDYQAYYNWGNALAALGKKKEAIEKFKKAIEIKPDYHEAYYNRGNALANLGKKKEAIEKYKKAIEIKPDYHEAYYNWGNALDGLGKKKEAIEKYKKAIEIKPDDHEAYSNWGAALDDLGKYKEAIEKYKKAIEIKPDDHQAYYNWGTALTALGKQEEAIEKYKKAVEIKPDKHEAYSNWGAALIDSGKLEKNSDYYKQAIEILKKGEKINPEAMSYNLACAYSLSKKTQLALQYLKKAIKYDPKFRQIALEEKGDFDSLRDNPEFIALVSRPGKKTAAKAKRTQK